MEIALQDTQEMVKHALILMSVYQIVVIISVLTLQDHLHVPADLVINSTSTDLRVMVRAFCALC